MTLLGYCQKFAGKDDAARLTFTRAAAAMKPTPDSAVIVDARELPAYLAWVYAGLGEKEKALEQARHAIADYDSDALGKPFAEASLAIVEAQLGDIDSAVAALPHLLEVPMAKPAAIFGSIRCGTRCARIRAFRNWLRRSSVSLS